jgi:hypothetical protein
MNLEAALASSLKIGGFWTNTIVVYRKGIVPLYCFKMSDFEAILLLNHKFLRLYEAIQSLHRWKYS